MNESRLVTVSKPPAKNPAAVEAILGVERISSHHFRLCSPTWHPALVESDLWSVGYNMNLSL